MGLGTVFQLSASFIQFFAAITAIPKITLPQAWTQPMYYVDVVNLNIPILSDVIPSLADFRVFFTAVCIILPLSLICTGLFFLNSIVVLVWYLLLLCGFSLVVAVILAEALKKQIVFDYSTFELDAVLITGIVLLAAMSLAAAVWRFMRMSKPATPPPAQPQQQQQAVDGDAYTDRDDDNEEDQTTDPLEHVVQEKEEAVKRISVPVTIQRVVGLLFFLLVAVLFLATPPTAFSLPQGLVTLQQGLGITSAVIAALFLCALGLSLTRPGREVQWKVYMVAEHEFMRFLLVVMSLLYIPIGAVMFMLFNCAPPRVLMAPSSHRKTAGCRETDRRARASPATSRVLRYVPRGTRCAPEARRAG